jgi:hypothetical protein
LTFTVLFYNFKLINKLNPLKIMKKILFLIVFSLLFVLPNKASDIDPYSSDLSLSNTVFFFKPSPFGEYNRYFSIGSGYGRSFGGFGVRVQWRGSGNFAFGPHIGLGYTPNSIGFPIFVNAGCKMFFYKPFYADIQFGVFGENSEYIDSWSGGYTDEWPAWGPSILGGMDLNISEMFGINAAGGISLDIGGTEIFPAFDIGFFIRF